MSVPASARHRPRHEPSSRSAPNRPVSQATDPSRLAGGGLSYLEGSAPPAAPRDCARPTSLDAGGPEIAMRKRFHRSHQDRRLGSPPFTTSTLPTEMQSYYA